MTNDELAVRELGDNPYAGDVVTVGIDTNQTPAKVRLLDAGKQWLEHEFEGWLNIYQAAPHEREYRFDEDRKWRFDFAWPERKIAVEIEGAIYSQGRHTRPQGFMDDCEKYNAAALLGWRVFRVPGPWIYPDWQPRYMNDLMLLLGIRPGL